MPPERTSTPLGGAASSYNTADITLLESETDKSFSQSALQSSLQQKQLHKNDAAIIQREREIEDIAQGIIDLSDLFRDLQSMIIDQGTMLDRIDYNVERMATDVQAAEKELNVASGYQKKTTKRKIIFLLFLLVVGMFILLLVKPKRGGGDGADGGGAGSGGGGSPAEISPEEGIVKARRGPDGEEPDETFGAETLALVRRTLDHLNYRPSKRGG